MTPEIPDLIRPMLQDYLLKANEGVPGLISAFYLEGSIALGGFNELFSDIDFVAFLARQATSSEIDTLRHIHKKLEARHAKWAMSGSYILLDDLREPTSPKPSLTYHGGRLKQNGHFELQSVEGWILKNHGIALMGPDPHDLPYAVDWALLTIWMKENLNSYWADWTRRPDRFVRLFSDWGIQWTVLGVLRQFYSFREHSITTKAGAGRYALTCVPHHWHGLIQEALNIRAGKPASAYRFRVTRALAALRFLRFVIQTCNDDRAANPYPSG